VGGEVLVVYGGSSRLGLFTCDVTGVGGGVAIPPPLVQLSETFEDHIIGA